MPRRKKTLNSKFKITVGPHVLGMTGDGGNGRIEPNKPTHMMRSQQGPVTLHEGEAMVENQDGTFTVIPQDQLQQFEKTHNVRGFQVGGTFRRESQPLSGSMPTSNVNRQQGALAAQQAAKTAAARAGRYTPNVQLQKPNVQVRPEVQPSGTFRREPQPLSGAVPSNNYNKQTGPLAAQQAVGLTGRGAGTVAPSVQLQKPVVRAPEQVQQSAPAQLATPAVRPPPQISDPTAGGRATLGRTDFGRVQESSTMQGSLAAREAARKAAQQAATAGRGAGLAGQRAGAQAAQEAARVAAQETAAREAQQATQNEVADVVEATPPGPGIGQQALQEAMAFFRNQMSGLGTADRTAANFYLDNLRSANAAERQALQQDLAQSGITGSAAQAIMGRAARAAGSQQAQLAGQLALGAQERAAQSAARLGSLGTTQEQLRQAQERIGLQERGLGLEEQRIGLERERVGLQERGMELQERQQDIAEQKWGAQEGSIVAADVGRGVSLERINAGRAQRGQVPITQVEYDEIRDAGVLGERDFGRRLQGIEAMLAAGGEGNYQNAAAQMNEMFPGLGIDFSNLIKQENAAEFADGMATMVQMIESGLSFDEALPALRSAGVPAQLGIGGRDARKMYNELQAKSSPVYKALNSISDQQWADMFPDMTADEAKTWATKTMLFGDANFDPNGNFSVDPIMDDELPSDEVPDIPFDQMNLSQQWQKFNESQEGLPTEQRQIYTEWLKNPIEKNKQAEPWDAFNKTQEGLPEEQQVGFEVWQQAGEPKTYQDFVKSSPVFAAQQAIGGNIGEQIRSSYDANQMIDEGPLKDLFDLYYKNKDSGVLQPYLADNQEIKAFLEGRPWYDNVNKTISNKSGVLTTVNPKLKSGFLPIDPETARGLDGKMVILDGPLESKVPFVISVDGDGTIRGTAIEPSSNYYKLDKLTEEQKKTVNNAYGSTLKGFDSKFIIKTNPESNVVVAE